MEAPFFYIPDMAEQDTRIQLDEDSANHCIRVLRRKPGDPVILTNGKGIRKEAVIETTEKKYCTVLVHSSQIWPPPEPQIAIGISFTKNSSRIEWFLEKVTEIGISHVFPLLCKRTGKAHYKFPRLQHIMVSAMLQSQQYYLPTLHPPVRVEELITTNTSPSRLIAHCEKDDKDLLKDAIIHGEDTLLLIGPEGDFTSEEIAVARKEGFIPVSLGQNRLRTETAGIVACTLMHAINER